MPTWIGLAQAAAQPPFYANPIFLFAIILGIWWFLLIRPQRQQEKRHRGMLDALKVGDKVLTSGGIHGVVAQVGEKTLKIKVADNVRIEFSRSAIASLQEETGPEGDKPKE